MTSRVHSMDPQQAAQAFFGLDEPDFDKMIAKLAQNDPRLVQVFKNTRARFLKTEQKN
ncbi:MAG: hypothetical protein AAFU41_16310 [Pseudomonadota bacterium]